MYKEVILAVVQALTEFLPISSSGHLALFGNYFGDVNLFYVTLLHCASVLAIIVYTRREIRDMVTLANDAARSMWLYVAIGIIPAGIIGLFFRAAIENAFSSPLIIGVGFIFTGNILILCYSFQKSDQELTKKRALLVGLAQILALFPGVSRSGTTISFGIFAGLKRDVAFRFSFLMAIPLIIAATAINFNYAAITFAMIVGFVICFIVSLLSLKLLEMLLKRNYFWVFGVYCLTVGIIVLFQTFQ